MLDLIASFSLYSHIMAGSLTLLTGPMAIFYNFRDPRKHRLVGKIFYYAMLWVVITSVVGFLKRPEVAFYQFLLGISLMVLAGMLRGVRSIFLMKGAVVSRIDWGYTLLLGLNALYMLGMSAWHFSVGTMVAIPILFAVFGTTSLMDVRTNWKTFSQPEKLGRLDWMNLHSMSMIGAFIASTTAFTVNAAHFLPWWAQWFGPTILLAPVQIYFGRKIRNLGNKMKMAA
ncbi:MAG TPA: hypothetical protein DCF33_00810 [Saprospirales bacterium]|nr:hypothetical protein [Saprospirales bacterium]